MPRLAAGNNQFQAFLADLPAFQNYIQIYNDCLSHAEETVHPETLGALKHELQLEDISFRYEAGGPAVLDGLSLTVEAGSITAIVGVSGAGKSTVADLVNGLLQPETGRIMIDGVELTRLTTRSWRHQIGYVAQDTVLFHDTIRENLLWAKPGVTEGAMREALGLAAAEFVFDLPRGLDTIVGDRGVLLSNGQRQRVALARALLRRPSFLILDEATNSLDGESEGRILDAIDQIKRRTTVLLIAHRSSAIQRADTIYVIDGGRVAEHGSWNDLRDKLSAYPEALIHSHPAGS
jgi:ATP-binding cassette subfamily C protein